MIETDRIIAGDCLESMKALPDCCVDAIVSDPPYGLSSEPDAAEVLRHWLRGDDYKHRGGGFMGKAWDSFVPGPAIWREALRVLKPGGHVLAFFGTRTYDLGVTAMRLAGFEVRDQLAWMYGSGFPKSLNVALAIDKAAGVQKDRGAGFNTAGKIPGVSYDGQAGAFEAFVSEGPGSPWNGWGTALKPAQEPIVLARKPLVGTVAANVLAHGTGGINVDACRIETDKPIASHYNTSGGQGHTTGKFNTPYQHGDAGEHNTQTLGRWPANVLLDEAAAQLLDQMSGELKSGAFKEGTVQLARSAHAKGAEAERVREGRLGDSGGASRFFYVAKTSTAEREHGLNDFPIRSGGECTDRVDGSDGLNSPRAGAGRGGGRANVHPTVKPVELMRYLVRLITPPGGIVLDPFAGSGTTGCAAKLEGKHFLLMELDPEYVAIAQARIDAIAGPSNTPIAWSRPKPATNQLSLLDLLGNELEGVG